MSNALQRTLQAVNLDYHNLCAIVGEKTGQLKNLEAEIEQHVLALKGLSIELLAHKAAMTGVEETINNQVSQRLAAQDDARSNGQLTPRGLSQFSADVISRSNDKS